MSRPNHPHFELNCLPIEPEEDNIQNLKKR